MIARARGQSGAAVLRSSILGRLRSEGRAAKGAEDAGLDDYAHYARGCVELFVTTHDALSAPWR